MRVIHWVLGLAWVLSMTAAEATEKQFPVMDRIAIDQGGRRTHETLRRGYGFRVEVVADGQGVKSESFRDGRPYLVAERGERYSIRLTNPLPVRVAVNLSVDGLNSITGKPSGIADGDKWMLEPYSTVTIPGWQVNEGEARRFFFTDKPQSYAQWRSERTGKDLAANCGVIGAAFFWDQEELDRYHEDHPIVRDDPQAAHATNTRECDRAASPAGALAASCPMRKAAAEEAGTGMGERQSHPTRLVDFHYNRGMYRLDEAVVLYYGFEGRPSPDPFPAQDYAPEMPR